MALPLVEHAALHRGLANPEKGEELGSITQLLQAKKNNEHPIDNKGVQNRMTMPGMPTRLLLVRLTVTGAVDVLWP